MKAALVHTYGIVLYDSYLRTITSYSSPTAQSRLSFWFTKHKSRINVIHLILSSLLYLSSPSNSLTMSSKYSWHPPHRPPPADPSLAGRIAIICPVGRCLETALNELLADDQITTIGRSDSATAATADGDDGDRHHDNNGTITHKNGTKSNKKRKRATEEINRSQECESVGSGNNNVEESIHEEHVARASESRSNVRLDDAMSKSILEAYSKSVVETKFDQEKKIGGGGALPFPTSSGTKTIIPPAAMLKGEIDHYNRVGGQWRIVVKNAVLMERSTTTVGNGKTGRSLRKRTVLDWDDGDSDNACEKGESASDDGNACGDSNAPSGVHHFKGTVQILAYDDI
mmetsp:Transcript_3303/g.6333  ORF Transcript_3303/g.6333 Transcript_3303/m.6333 type:complete len:343 (+) Transcript_3303:227-1255(+)